MKKILTFILVLGMASFAGADLQAQTKMEHEKQAVQHESEGNIFLVYCSVNKKPVKKWFLYEPQFISQVAQKCVKLYGGTPSVKVINDGNKNGNKKKHHKKTGKG